MLVLIHSAYYPSGYAVIRFLLIECKFSFCTCRRAILAFILYLQPPLALFAVNSTAKSIRMKSRSRNRSGPRYFDGAPVCFRNFCAFGPKTVKPFHSSVEERGPKSENRNKSKSLLQR